jgi:ribonuclease J
MKICIHRGANQIGGSCVEVECRNSRIVLDVGLPLNVVSPDDVELPDVPGFTSPDPSLLGVIISHPHLDHYGLVSRINKTIPIFLGEAAQRILEVASLFTGNKVQFSNVMHLIDRKQIDLGPFRITPFLMDHSAFDSYAVLVEADNKKLLYTGDLSGCDNRKLIRRRG